jgi:hypothetical protein
VKPITVHTLPRTVFPPITLKGGYDKVRIPRSRGFGLIRPASTQPRPGLGVHRRLAGKKGQRGTGLKVISPSRPRRHHGVQGWPAIPGARRYSHPHRDRQNFTSRHPGALASSYPIKGQTKALQGVAEQDTSQKPGASKRRHNPQINTSNNHPCTLSFPLRPGLSSLSHSL